MMTMLTPLFWNLSTDPEKQAASQAVLIKFYYDNFGAHLDIPTPPRTSVAAWKVTIEENSEEIERMMKLPSHSHKLEER